MTDLEQGMERRERRRRPSRLVASSLGMIALAVVAIAFASTTRSLPPPVPGSVVAQSEPIQSTSAAATLPAAPASAPYEAGQLLRATGSFALGGDWTVHLGQSMYVVARHRNEAGDEYLIQHWGDLETGLKPDTVIGTVDASILVEHTAPYQPACPTTVTRVEHVAALQVFERLACFGAREIGFGPVRHQEYAVMQGSPPWLGGEAGLDFFTALPFAPADGIGVPKGPWLQVTGQFDDAGCGEDLRCRERFVVTSAIQAPPPTTELQGVWTRMADAPIDGRSSYVAIETDRGTFIWGGDITGENGSGAIYDAGANRWTEIAPTPGVDRIGAAAAWSGTQVLIWGGQDWGLNEAKRDGLAYDPDADRWSEIPNAPIAGGLATGAWTGSELIVVSTKAHAAAWDPASGAWRRLPDPPIPPGYLESVWTGDELILLGLTEGGADPIVSAAYDPATSTWRTIADVPYDGLVLGIPPRWAGTMMVFVDHAYDPTTDRWTQLAIDGCAHGAVSYGVWTGRCASQPDTGLRPGREPLLDAARRAHPAGFREPGLRAADS